MFSASHGSPAPAARPPACWVLHITCTQLIRANPNSSPAVSAPTSPVICLHVRVSECACPPNRAAPQPDSINTPFHQHYNNAPLLTAAQAYGKLYAGHTTTACAGMRICRRSAKSRGLREDVGGTGGSAQTVAPLILIEPARQVVVVEREAVVCAVQHIRAHALAPHLARQCQHLRKRQTWAQRTTRVRHIYTKASCAFRSQRAPVSSSTPLLRHLCSF